MEGVRLLLPFLIIGILQVTDGNETFANAGDHFHFRNNGLYRRIFTGYRKEVSPYSKKADHNIPVRVSLIDTRIVSLDQVEEVLHLIVYFRLIWHDGRLAWTPEENGGINHIYVPMNKVWMPKIIIMNEEFFEQSNLPNVLINNTGYVHYYSYRIADIVCPLKNDLFPFDRQICSLTLVRRRCYEVNDPPILTEKSENLNKSWAGNGEWDVRSILLFEMSVNDTDGPIDFVNFDFLLERKPHFYVVMVIFPTVIMTTLTIFGIFGRHTSIEHEFITELSLGITSLTTIALMLDIVAEHMPKTNVYPLISKFLILHITLMSVSMLTVIIHPRFLYPKYRRIRAALLKSMESEVMPASAHRDRILRILRQSLKKYRPANVVFMIFFQSLNFGSCVYIFSKWN